MYLIRRLTPLFIVTFALAWLGLSPSAQAVVPKPDGGYGLPLYGAGNTAEGTTRCLDSPPVDTTLV